jgi:hypothetical protein
LKDCLLRGEAPYASHLLYTQEGVLDDNKPEERRLGMEAGFAWGRALEPADCTNLARKAKRVVYTDRGISGGMAEGIKLANKMDQEVEYRKLGGQWAMTVEAL